MFSINYICKALLKATHLSKNDDIVVHCPVAPEVRESMNEGNRTDVKPAVQNQDDNPELYNVLVGALTQRLECKLTELRVKAKLSGKDASTVKLPTDYRQIANILDDESNKAPLIHGLNKFFHRFPINTVVSGRTLLDFIESIKKTVPSEPDFINQKAVIKFLQIMIEIGNPHKFCQDKFITRLRISLADMSDGTVKYEGREHYGISLSSLRSAISYECCNSPLKKLTAVRYLGATFGQSTAVTQASQIRSLLVAMGVAKAVKWAEDDVLYIDYRFVDLLTEQASMTLALHKERHPEHKDIDMINYLLLREGLTPEILEEYVQANDLAKYDRIVYKN